MKTRGARTKFEERIEEYLSEPTGDGGYPPQFAFVGNYIIVADVDHDDAPKLTIQTVAEWLTHHDWLFEDEEQKA